MFKVQGFPIAADEILILEELKNQLALAGLEYFGRFKKSSKNIQFCCPMLHNGRMERKPSCGISTEDKVVNGKLIPAGTVHCFTCGYTTNLQTMISDCFGYDDEGQFGKDWLQKNFLTIAIEDRTDLILDFSRTPQVCKTEYVSEDELDSYRYTHPYLYKRGMTDELIEKFDLGYDPHFELTNDKGKIVGRLECITFPVRDITGGTVFVARRGIKTKFFKYPDDSNKPIYGLYELPKDCREIIVCESMFNAITCYKYGKPAVALLGTGNPAQFKALSELPVRKIICGFDPDEAGAKATANLKKYVNNKIITQFIYPQYGKGAPDINDFSEEEFNSLQETY